MEELSTTAAPCADKIRQLRESIASVVVGQSRATDLLLTCIIARGHVLIEGVPGVAKTLLARVMAQLVDARFKRVQFTPDLMPSDVLGTTVYNMKTGVFDFHAGPIFADMVLADEINRAPAKTQAALFEVMEERQVTIDGQTHPMSDVFTVIATQNPVEQEGTYKLPEAQLDRFLMKITMDYPSTDEEVEILNRHQTADAFSSATELKPVLTPADITMLRSAARDVRMDESLLRYIAGITAVTRQSKAVYLGASPRAAVAIMVSAKAYALLQERDFVIPDDIKEVAPYVMHHRLILTAEAEMQGFTPLQVARRLIDKVEIPQ